MVPFDNKANSEFSFFEYSETGGNNDSIRKRMKKILSEAIKNELTKRQKECIMQYYYEHKSVREIAENTGIKPTTVYKHINKARKAIKKCSCYL